MSSGTQIDPNWTGAEAGQTGVPPPPASMPDATGVSAGRYLTDEEILGIEPPSSASGDLGGRVRQGERSDLEAQGSDFSAAPLTRNDTAQINVAMPAWMVAAAGDPRHAAEAQALWQEHQEFRAAFSSPAEARTIKEMFPGGAQEAVALRQASQSVDRIDAAIFSGDTRAQSEVVAEIARTNPAAFRSLFAEAARVLAEMGQPLPVAAQQNSNFRQNREGWDGRRTQNVVVPNEARDLSLASSGNQQRESSSDLNSGPPRNEAMNSSATAPSFDPAAYASFERNTNDVVARDVRSAIGDTLSRVMPEGVAEGAARRIGDDIFNEIHRALAADRTLSEQVGEALRAPFAAGQGWRFGTAEQQRVASLLSARAKQLVPSVSRRVIGEWTSSVLGTARTKATRQAIAASRVDIGTPGGSRDSMPLRAMSSRDVDYASMSDDQILGM